MGMTKGMSGETMNRPDDDLVVPFPGLAAWLLAGVCWLVIIAIVAVLQRWGVL